MTGSFWRRGRVSKGLSLFVDLSSHGGPDQFKGDSDRNKFDVC